MMKKGQNQLDWIIGLALFFVAFSLLFFYLKYYIFQPRPMSEVMENFVYNFMEKIPDYLGSNIFLFSPIYYREKVENHPFIIHVETNESVSFVNYEKGSVLSFDKLSSYEYRVLLSFPSQTYMIISKNLKNPCITDIKNLSAGFTNQKAFINYSYGNVKTNILILKNTGPIIDKYKKCSFGEINTTYEKVLLDAFSPRIWIIKKSIQNATLSVNISLISNLTLSNDNIINYLRNISLKNITWINISLKKAYLLSDYKILIVFNKSDIYLYNKSGELIINISTSPIELFYDNSSEKFNGEIHYYSKTIKFLPKLQINVLSQEKITRFETEDPTLSSILGSVGKIYNITIGKYIFGYKPPLIGNVYVVNLIMPLLYENGVLNASKISIKIWQ